MTFGDTATRTLLAVATQARPTVRSVAGEVDCTVSTAHDHLRKLRAAGLVTWDDGRQGTLRLTCGFVPTDPCSAGRLEPETSGPRVATTTGDLADTKREGWCRR